MKIAPLEEDNTNKKSPYDRKDKNVLRAHIL